MPNVRTRQPPRRHHPAPRRIQYGPHPPLNAYTQAAAAETGAHASVSAVGQSVNAGDVLVVLEAMKMEIEVSAPVAGTVKAVAASVGTAVNTDDLLVTLG